MSLTENKKSTLVECEGSTVSTTDKTSTADRYVEQDCDYDSTVDDEKTQSERTRDKKIWKKCLAFRGMLLKVFHGLPEADINALAFVYSETRDIQNGIKLVEKLVNHKCLCDNIESLKILAEHLDTIKRTDLKSIVDDYIVSKQGQSKLSGACIASTQKPPPISSHPPQPNPPLLSQQSRVSSSQDLASLDVAIEETYDVRRTAPVGIGKKRLRLETAEEKDLEEAAAAMEIVCDTTSDSSDENEPEPYSPTSDDRRYMKQARDAAKNSKDEETKVGSVLVSNGEVVGVGWNRMPKGCEGMFNWDRDREKEPLEEGKHLYVVYAIRASIFDAYKKKADLTGATLYTTLFPSNICAQCIREAGISKVVWCSDKFHKTKFMKASRRLLNGIECRCFDEKN